MSKTTRIVAALAMAATAAWGGFKAEPLVQSGSGGTPFAFQFSVGMLNGDAVEHVYDYDLGYRRQLSRLDWDLKNVIMGGGSGSIRPFDGQDFLDRFTLNGGLWIALTEGNGEMDDYDWLDYYSTDWTHYSLSDVDVTEGYILELNVAFDVWRNDQAVVRVMGGYKQDGWSWEDHGVYLLYPEYGYIPQYQYGENNIDYEQEFRMPYLGGGGDLLLGDLTLSGYVMWSPIVEATDWDDHLARDLAFKESFDGGDVIGAGVSARYDFTQGSFKGLFLTAGLDFQAVDLIIGDMEVRDTVTGETGGGEDVAGIENEYMLISVGGGFTF